MAIREDLEALASQENVTLFLTTHNMVDAEKLCHQVAVIAAGGLVAQGTPDELKHRLSTPGVEIKGRGFTGEALALLKSIP